MSSTFFFFLEKLETLDKTRNILNVVFPPHFFSVNQNFDFFFIPAPLTISGHLGFIQ